MPLTLTVTEGVLPEGTEKETFARLCQAMLDCHGLTGNRVMTPNVIGSFHVLRKDQTFSGMNEVPVVFIEWKVPSFAFATRDVQQRYFEEATRIVQDASGGRQPKEHIWINVVHAADGAWGIDGRALTNAELGALVAAG